MYKNSVKVSKNMPDFERLSIRLIFIKNAPNKTHRYLRCISFRKSSQIWAKLAHRLVNRPEMCMKIWQTPQKSCPTLRGCNSLDIYRKCSKREKTHRYLRCISFRKSKSAFGPSWPTDPVNRTKTCMKIW